jgi:chlorobactene glucosyltransferase
MELQFGLTLLALIVLLGLLMVCIHRLSQLRPLRASAPPAPAPTISVIIPARNEAANIERCVRGILDQTYPRSNLDIIVVNDGSTDATAAIVERIAAIDARVRLIDAGPLPRGWTGKANACMQGANAATGDWLCFIDADTAAAPLLLASAITETKAQSLDFLSVYPFQELGSFWERLILPLSILSFAFSTSIRKANDPASPDDAAAIGQCIAVRRAAYDSVHGHAAVRADILEDVMLAKAIKRAGYACRIVYGDRLIRTRMYTSLATVWDGIAKNAVDGAGSIWMTVLGGIGALALAWVPLLLVIGALLEFNAHQPLSIATLVVALLALLTTFGTYRAMQHVSQVRAWYCVFFPIATTVGALILFNSAWRRVTRTNVWKGRIYAFDSE